MKPKTALLWGVLIFGMLIGLARYSPEPTPRDYAELLLDTAFAELAQ